jgi:hypothetical protein
MSEKESSNNTDQPRTKMLEDLLSKPNVSLHGDEYLASKFSKEELDARRDEMFKRLFAESNLDNEEALDELKRIRAAHEKGDSVPPVGRVRPPRARQRKKRNGE